MVEFFLLCEILKIIGQVLFWIVAVCIVMLVVVASICFYFICTADDNCTGCPGASDGSCNQCRIHKNRLKREKKEEKRKLKKGGM